MPETEAPDQVQETPTDEEAPESQDTQTESTDTSDVDWEKRYNDLRPEWDRANQELAQYRTYIENLSSPETQAEALAALGLELEEEDEDFEDEDFEDDSDNRLEQIEAYLAEQELAAEEEAELDFAEEFVRAQLEELDPQGEFSDTYLDLLIASAPEDENGLPDLGESHAALQQELENQRQKYVQSKRVPQVGSGASPSHQPNLDTQEGREEFMLQRIQAEQGLE